LKASEKALETCFVRGFSSRFLLDISNFEGSGLEQLPSKREKGVGNL